MDQEVSYRLKADAAVRDLLLEFECQPILFVGSGISRRYFSAPTWHELLKTLFSKLPNGDESFEYNRQKYDNDPIKIGDVLADEIFEWAWKEGRDYFPAEFFTSSFGKDCFLKHLACQYLISITPTASELTNEDIQKELEAFAAIKPHAIITNNYDLFLEEVFSG